MDALIRSVAIDDQNLPYRRKFQGLTFCGFRNIIFADQVEYIVS